MTASLQRDRLPGQAEQNPGLQKEEVGVLREDTVDRHQAHPLPENKDLQADLEAGRQLCQLYVVTQHQSLTVLMRLS